MSMRGLLQRPTIPRINAGVCRMSFALSARVMMMAVALSVSTQQSSRCSGLQIIRLLITSSTVYRFFVICLRIIGRVFGMHDF